MREVVVSLRSDCPGKTCGADVLAGGSVKLIGASRSWVLTVRLPSAPGALAAATASGAFHVYRVNACPPADRSLILNGGFDAAALTSPAATGIATAVAAPIAASFAVDALNDMPPPALVWRPVGSGGGQLNISAAQPGGYYSPVTPPNAAMFEARGTGTAAGVEQTVTGLVPYSRYALTASYTGDYSCTGGSGPSYLPDSLGFRVEVSGWPLAAFQRAKPTFWGTNSLKWTTLAVNFTATADTEVIRFMALASGSFASDPGVSPPCGPMLDDVRLLPLPSSGAPATAFYGSPPSFSYIFNDFLTSAEYAAPGPGGVLTKYWRGWAVAGGSASAVVSNVIKLMAVGSVGQAAVWHRSPVDVTTSFT